MRKHLFASLLLVARTVTVGAAVEEGTVLKITSDTITLQQGGSQKLAVRVSNELLTNNIPNYPNSGDSAKFTDIKINCKIQIEYIQLDGQWVCSRIQSRAPDDAGVVTEVGADSLTIRNDKGVTTTYKVKKDLVANSRDRYSVLYPSRFSEVTQGCRIEIACSRVNGELIASGLDVKTVRPKEK